MCILMTGGHFNSVVAGRPEPTVRLASLTRAEASAIKDLGFACRGTFWSECLAMPAEDEGEGKSPVSFYRLDFDCFYIGCFKC